MKIRPQASFPSIAELSAECSVVEQVGERGSE